MQPTVFGIIVVLLGLWAQFGSPARPLILIFGLTVFGAASALDLPALGGASVTPANLFLIFYILRIVSAPSGLRYLTTEINPSRPLFLFLLLTLWVLFSALALPRLFEGSIDVFSLSRSESNEGDLTPLHPTGGNVSQAIYAIGGFCSAVLTAIYTRRFVRTATIFSALAICTGLHLAFAGIDVVSGATHTGFVLDPIHTASYSFLTTDELGGLKRISGSFSEASAFATFSLTLLAVNFTLFVLAIAPLYTGTASVLLTVFIAAATSSAGYVGLTALFGIFLIYALVNALLLGRTRALGIALAALSALVVLSAAVVLFIPSIADIAQTVVNDSLLTKSTSESAIERGAMNVQAWQVLKDTYGIGAGIGATRASNYALVLLSNLGVPGFLLFVAMIMRLTSGGLPAALPRETHALVWAARAGVVATLVPSLLTGTVYDLGTLFYCLVGIASADLRPSSAWATDRVAASKPRLGMA